MYKFNNIPIVIYSHSEFQDILRVQNDFIKNIKNIKILFINKLPNFEHNFDKIILYDDQINYSKKLYNCLIQLKNEYTDIFFLHDNDIIIKFNMDHMNNLYTIMKTNNIHRLDLQYTDNNDDKKIIYNDDITLCIAYHYIYNVNPSFWNVDVFIDIMNKFDKNYRNIEDNDVQSYVKSNYNIYKLHSKTPISVGYFKLTSVFIYLHLTNYRKLLPLSNNNLVQEINNIYQDMHNIYKFDRIINSTLY